MRTPRFWQPVAAMAIGGASLFGAMAAHAIYNPPIHMVNGVEYMSGGIGTEEAELMETVSPRWPATFEFAVKDGKRADFAADVLVTVRNASGEPVLRDIVSNGPMLVARLEAGRYEVEATLGGRTLKQQVDVVQGSASRTVFVWPTGTSLSALAPAK
jgi:hypothetical protein